MKESQDNLDVELRWQVRNSLLWLETDLGARPVTSADVVGVEHRGQATIDGINTYVKPSMDLPHISFNRFPLSLIFTLLMPSVSHQKPELHLQATFGKQIYSLEHPPHGDQLIIQDNQWYPLFESEVQEMNCLLDKAGILSLGRITFQQAICLLQQNSYLIRVENFSEIKEIDNHVADDFEKFSQKLKSKGFKANLYDYQKSGLTWLKAIVDEGLGCVLADEMGLGKTLQIIALLTCYKNEEGSTCLVIAPATLLENWRREFVKFSPRLSVLIHSGLERTGFPSALKKYDVIITSYDLAVRDQGMLGMIRWDFVILDEAQAIKNPETHRAKAVKNLDRQYSIAVTGTPVENRLLDLWSIMDFACPNLLGSYADFNKIYTDDIESAERLEKIVTPLILRREVSEVARDLPEKIVIPQAVVMTQMEKEEYEHLRLKARQEYGQHAGLVSLLLLRQYCTHRLLIDEFALSSDHASTPLSSSKFQRLLEILEEIFAHSGKAIIFTSFHKMTDMIATEIPICFEVPSWQIDGRTVIPERQAIVDQFSNHEGPAVLVLNPKAAGTGLNITAANHVVHYNLQWNPAVEDQATSRAYRRGQDRPVTVHRLFYPLTVEEIINERLERKRDLAETAVIGTEGKLMDARDIARAMQLSPILFQGG